jgi:hypothetical protein
MPILQASQRDVSQLLVGDHQKINQLLDTAELRAGPLRRSSVEVAH